MNQKYSALMSVYYKETASNLRISIDSMINQTIPPEEFILVVDGLLTPELDTVVKEYENKYPELFTILRFDENRGLGPALASGIEASRNELIARMDSDDYVVNTRCEKQLKIFEKNPKIGIVGSKEVEFVVNINNVVAVHGVPETNEEIIKFMRRRCAILHPTVMYKKSDVLRSGNYRKINLYEDYDLFARMIFENQVMAYNIQEKLYYIRTSEDFFKRRGGYQYAKTALKFKYGMYKKKYMSLIDFIISGLGQFIVCCMPNGIRTWFYNAFLRE